MKDGLHSKDIRKCFGCGEGLAPSGPICYRVRLQQFGLDHAAIQRTAGLEMMMQGHVALAAAMGPDEQLAVPLSDEKTGLLCGKCSNSPSYMMLLGLLEEPEEGAEG
jgi:hypothetical protein